MKLLAKTNIFTSAATIILMLAGMFIIYLLVLNKIKGEEDEHLLIEKAKIIKLLEHGENLSYYSSTIGESIEIKEIAAQTIFSDRFMDYQTEEEEGEEGEEEFTLRQLLFQTPIDGKYYEIKISHSLSESREIGEYISVAILLFLSFSFFILLLLNRFISKIIWAPFYNMLIQLRGWTITENKKIEIKKTNIDEFLELNQTINTLIHKIQTDYISLKEFTENISHETQTPVAVISAKLEMLMQEKEYSVKQQQLLADAYTATIRLKKLNHALVLLTRIEKGIYEKTEVIDLSNAIERKLAELKEFIQAKEITIEKDLEPIEKQINPEVFNILLNNLLINAIKHNRQYNGIIKVVLKRNELLIQNTGSDLKIDKENLFERLTPYSTDKESIGLGLSIIKKITDFSGWSIFYEFDKGLHSFRICW
jgi:signal transduction histidine kinase